MIKYNENGSTMVYVILVIFLMTILITGMLAMSVSNFKFIAKSTNSNQVYYKSDAVMESILFKINDNGYPYLKENYTKNYKKDELIKEIIDAESSASIEMILNDYEYNYIDRDDYFDELIDNITDGANSLHQDIVDLIPDDYSTDDIEVNLNLNNRELAIDLNGEHTKTIRTVIEINKILDYETNGSVQIYMHDDNKKQEFYNLVEELVTSSEFTSMEDMNNYKNLLQMKINENSTELDYDEDVYIAYLSIAYLNYEDVKNFSLFNNLIYNLSNNDTDQVTFQSPVEEENFEIYTIESWKVVDE